ncbi:hypothetical protein FJT64_017052 [Amphibalanus amphitrite]|uniref:Uncharacterized protein n=1 Tax=Amphibalanus amphitrite TaxID=1232801 RepID=A0A6A4X3W7_AMPAM|nr:hypothetical protein FJT64_017052 [Amphibalanus amphitrite]
MFWLNFRRRKNREKRLAAKTNLVSRGPEEAAARCRLCRGRWSAPRSRRSPGRLSVSSDDVLDEEPFELVWTGVGGASGGGGSGSGSLSVSPATTGPPPLLSRRSVDESAMACGHRRPLVRHSSDDTRRRRESFAAGGPAHSSASSIGLGHGSVS